MFLSAYEPIQACQLLEELLGQVKQGFCTFIGLNFKWKHEHKQWRRGKQSEENSCSLLSHFGSTSWSPFFLCYIPFESLGSQESNASNRVWFGAEMRKIWPSEDNCIMSNGQFRKVNFTLRKFRNGIFFMVRNFAISHHEEPHCENFARGFSSWCEILPFRNVNFTLRKFRKEDLVTLRNSFESPVLRRCWCYSTTGSPRYFAWFLAL